MAITYTIGNIFNSEMQTLVNPVNTVGVMGNGLAKHFKDRYPEMFLDYKKRCNAGKFTVGKLHLFHADDKWILNFPTKTHWRGESKLNYIEFGLKEFVAIYATQNMRCLQRKAISGYNRL